MCGIAGIHVLEKGTRKPSREKLIELTGYLAEGIEERGGHATGFVAVSKASKQRDAKVVMRKRPMKAGPFVKANLHQFSMYPRSVLIHTRYSTKGDPKINKNNHPMVYGSCFAIHNGVINNDDYLFRQLEIERPAETDSAIIPVVLTDHFDDAATEALNKLRGNFAIAAIDPLRAPNCLLLGKNRFNPIVVYNNGSLLVWASTRNAIEKAWKQAFGADTEPNNFYVFKDEEVWLVKADDTVVKTSIPFQGRTAEDDRQWWQTGGGGGRTHTSSRSSLGRAIDSQRAERKGVEALESGAAAVQFCSWETGDGYVVDWSYYPPARTDKVYFWAKITRSRDNSEVSRGIMGYFMLDEAEPCPRCGNTGKMKFYVGRAAQCRECFNEDDNCMYEISVQHQARIGGNLVLSLADTDEDCITCEVKHDVDAMLLGVDEVLLEACAEAGYDYLYAEWLMYVAKPEDLGELEKAQLKDIEKAYNEKDELLLDMTSGE